MSKQERDLLGEIVRLESKVALLQTLIDKKNGVIMKQALEIEGFASGSLCLSTQTENKKDG